MENNKGKQRGRFPNCKLCHQPVASRSKFCDKCAEQLAGFMHSVSDALGELFTKVRPAH